MGTKVYIKALEGVVNDNGIFIVEDTGGPCFDFDIFTSEPKFGKKVLDVKVLEFGKGKITSSYTSMCKYFVKNGIFDKFKVSWEFYKKNGKLVRFLKFNNEDKDIKKQPWY